MSKSKLVRALATIAAAAAVISSGAASSASQRGVAALGRLEPLGGTVRVAAPSTPDAVSGAVVVKLLVDRGTDVRAGQLLAEVDTGSIAKARVVEAQADLETARRDAMAAASVADEACVLADGIEEARARRRIEPDRRAVQDEVDSHVWHSLSARRRKLLATASR